TADDVRIQFGPRQPSGTRRTNRPAIRRALSLECAWTQRRRLPPPPPSEGGADGAKPRSPPRSNGGDQLPRSLPRSDGLEKLSQPPRSGDAISSPGRSSICRARRASGSEVPSI